MVPNAPLTPADDLKLEQEGLSIDGHLADNSNNDALARVDAEALTLDQLAQERARLLAEVARLECERQTWERERERLLAELEARSADAERTAGERADLGAAYQNWRSRMDGADQNEAGNVAQGSDNSPADDDGSSDHTTNSDPFARLQRYLRQQPRAEAELFAPRPSYLPSDLASEEESQVDEEDAYESPVTPSTASTNYRAAEDEQDELDESAIDDTQRAAAPAHAGEDESIEDYMAQLLNRMRGGGPSSPSSHGSPAARSSNATAETAAPQPASLTEGATEQVSDRKTTDDADTAAATAPAPARPVERAPRPQLKPADLAAMREVANMQTRHALDKHHRSRMSETVTAKLALAGIVMLMSGYALCFAEDFASRVAGGIGASLSGYWAIQGALAAAEYIRRHKKPAAETKSPEGPAAKPAEVSQPAAISQPTEQPQPDAQ